MKQAQKILVLAAPFMLFLILWCLNWKFPGVYMDAINPEYMIVRALYDSSSNVPVWVIPGNLLFGIFPVLTQIYHGSLTYYAGAPAFLLFGSDLLGIRMAGAWLAILVLLALCWSFHRLRLPLAVTILALLCLASDPAFIMNFRSQFHITSLPIALIAITIALLCGEESRKTSLLAGLFCGISIYGYFIYLFPVFMIGLLVLLAPWQRRTKLYWLLGTAIGVSLYAFGYLLMLLHIGGLGGFVERFLEFVHGQAPSQSDQSLGQRLSGTINYAVMAWGNRGNELLMLGEALNTPTRFLRHAVLVAMAVGFATLVLLRGHDRRAGLLTIAVGLGFLLLGLAFGNRLWVHHFAAMPALFGIFVAITLAGLWQYGCIGRWIATGLAAVLVCANLAAYQGMTQRLVQTGGVGLYSDAIVRFSEDMARDRRRPVVATADWGVFMPLAMISHGALPIIPEANIPQMRRNLCAGRDVVLSIILARGESRIAAWTEELGWGTPTRRPYDRRDGGPLLAAFEWRAADRPPGAAC